MRFLRDRTRAPLAVAGFLAVPLFFTSLMAVSLATERPQILHGHEHSPTSGTEARIWLLSLIAPVVLVAVGVVAVALGRHGIYASSAVAIVLVLALTSRIDTWTHRHTHRFPLGVDLIGPNDPSGDKLDPGQWENAARTTALSIGHWTIGLAAAAAVIAGALEFRRRRGPLRPAPPPPPEIVEGESRTVRSWGWRRRRFDRRVSI
jgi:hypothetical protein